MNSQMELNYTLNKLNREIRDLRSELEAMHQLISRSPIQRMPKNAMDSFIDSIPAAENTGGLDYKIANILLRLKISANLKGYKFLKEAVQLVYREPELLQAVTKILYPDIAKKFGDTPMRVERGIRHAIEVAWYKTEHVESESFFYHLRSRPTNSEFIALVAERLRLEASEGGFGNANQ